MGPELWVGVAAVFVSGGAVGAAGTLLAQWLVRRIQQPGDGPPTVRQAEVAGLREEIEDLSHHIRNIDARLDFQEQLLGGGTPTSVPPPRLPPQPESDPS